MFHQRFRVRRGEARREPPFDGIVAHDRNEIAPPDNLPWVEEAL